ncbi:substrate-binding domain-containing protein [Pleomorphomonas sp. JP5]|uniref:substrate-binding domain-containing protein n=1 Tax=Pleomorphomonas sp. JP5 TaxID=2942998 RepID=UPI002043EFF9|nr:substrate-binding domain-containing protein [Pleomorphomonas sp. JP5]MCM5559275.1 substrate-binding domain-containing protein [Pleomorphomonas sp. JP5]
MWKVLPVIALGLFCQAAMAGPVIGVSWPGDTTHQWKLDAEAIRDAVSAGSGAVIETDARLSAAKQILDVMSLIDAKVDALIVAAVDPRALEPSIRAAVAAGIPVIGYDRPIGLEGVLSIGFNQADVGRLQSLALYAARPRGGWVLLKGDFDDPQTARLYAGQIGVLKDSISAGLIRIAGEAYTPGGLSLNARRAFGNILDATRNDVDAVLTPDDASAGEAISVLEERGLIDKVAVVGQGGDPETLNRIARGVQTATIWEDHEALARKAAEAALQLADGRLPMELGVARRLGDGQGTTYELNLQPFTITVDALGLALSTGWIDAERLCHQVPAGHIADCP